MNVREWGPVEGPALVFWPGLNPWGALQLVEVGPLLAERGIHVLAASLHSISAPRTRTSRRGSRS